jgi:hypothetical protein
MKVLRAQDALRLEDIPNIGRSIAGDLRSIGILKPMDLKGKDGLVLYLKLNQRTGCRHDPCVADTFLAAVDFMNGGTSQPWWNFTPIRKKLWHQKGLSRNQ